MGMKIDLCGLALVAIASGCGESAPGSNVSSTGVDGGSTPVHGGNSTGSVDGGSDASSATSGNSGMTEEAGASGAIDASGPSAADGSPTVDGGADDAVSRDVNTSDAPQNFTCTLVLGAYQTSEWFDGGFRSAVGATRWEIKWEHNTYTELWADPTNAFWNIPTESPPCATNATTPDRVIFIVYSKTISAESDWETAVTKVVGTIKTKYPSAKLIQLLGMARAPNDQACPGNSDVAIVVGPAEQQAMQAVSDKSAGLVQVGPAYFVPDCASFLPNNTNLTPAAAAAVATMLAPLYK
jgi:hypothetical protein